MSSPRYTVISLPINLNFLETEYISKYCLTYVSFFEGESHEQPNVALNKSVSAPELPNRTIGDVAAVEVIGQGKESPRSTGSETDTDSTGRTVITPGRRNLDDAMLEDKDSSVVSTDTSFSSLSDESGGTSFHESSIKFSSTCVKIPSASTLTSRPENSINELMNETD